MWIQLVAFEDKAINFGVVVRRNGAGSVRGSSEVRHTSGKFTAEILSPELEVW